MKEFTEAEKQEFKRKIELEKAQSKTIQDLTDRELQEWIYRLNVKSEIHLKAIATFCNIMLFLTIISVSAGVFFAINLFSK